MLIPERDKPATGRHIVLSSIARSIVRPKALIPITLSAAALVGILSFGNIATIAAMIESIPLRAVLLSIAFLLLYELGRCILWLFLLHKLHASIPWRRKLLSFFMGEVSKTLPMGNYFPNYILQQSSGADFGYTSSATTAIVLLEIATSLVGLVVLGLGSWTVWLRPLILIGATTFCLLVWLSYLIFRGKPAPIWTERFSLSRLLIRELRQLRSGAERLWQPSVIITGLAICTVYVLAAGSSLYAITVGLQAAAIGWSGTIAVYCFSLAFALIEPSPVDLGILEAGGVAAFLVLGVDRNVAISAMLVSRILGIFTALALMAAALLYFRRDVKQLWKEPPRAARAPS